MMPVYISTADYLLEHQKKKVPSSERVTSAGRGLLKKEPSAVPSSYPASGYFVMVRAEKHFERNNFIFSYS